MCALGQIDINLLLPEGNVFRLTTKPSIADYRNRRLTDVSQDSEKIQIYELVFGPNQMVWSVYEWEGYGAQSKFRYRITLSDFQQ